MIKIYQKFMSLVKFTNNCNKSQQETTQSQHDCNWNSALIQIERELVGDSTIIDNIQT